MVTVLAVFALYTVFTPGPNPGQSWYGLLRYLTFTQIYTDNYLITLLHTGLSQMWSLAVEVSFYAVLPGLAYLLLRVVCRGQWRPRRALAALTALAAITPLWLVVVSTTDVAAELGRDVATRPHRVVRGRHGVGRSRSDRCPVPRALLRLAWRSFSTLPSPHPSAAPSWVLTRRLRR